MVANEYSMEITMELKLPKKALVTGAAGPSMGS